jgi:hypothetical protein
MKGLVILLLITCSFALKFKESEYYLKEHTFTVGKTTKYNEPEVKVSIYGKPVRVETFLQKNDLISCKYAYEDEWDCTGPLKSWELTFDYSQITCFTTTMNNLACSMHPSTCEQEFLEGECRVLIFLKKYERIFLSSHLLSFFFSL